MDKVKFKSGYVEATKKLEDRWICCFKRENPKEGKSKYWYVHLLVGEVPPSAGILKKFPEGSLERVKDFKAGCDTYSVIGEKAKGNVSYVPKGDGKDAKKVTTEEFMGFDSFDQAMYLTTAAMKIVISACPDLVNECNSTERKKKCMNLVVDMYSVAKNLEQASIDGIRVFTEETQ